MTSAATNAVSRLAISQRTRDAIAFGHRLVDVAFVADARQQQHVLAGFFLDDVDDVVDGDHADQPPLVVDHGSRHQGIFLEAQRDVFLVHVDRDQGLLARS